MRRITFTSRRATTKLVAILIVAGSLGAATFLAAQPRSFSPPAADRHHADQAGVNAGHARPLSIRVGPRSRSVDPEGVAKFRIRIRRSMPARHGGRRATVKLRVIRGLPLGATATFMRKRTRKRTSTLTVDTSSAASGVHRMRIRARSHGKRATGRARLIIAPIPAANFEISADPTASMAPGVSVPLDLTLANRETREIALSSLEARVSALIAPAASPDLPCTVDDFEVTPFSGAYGFRVPPGTTSLGELGFPPGQWPQLEMINRPLNQDGCKGASLTLAYNGTSTVGTP